MNSSSAGLPRSALGPLSFLAIHAVGLLCLAAGGCSHSSPAHHQHAEPNRGSMATGANGTEPRRLSSVDAPNAPAAANSALIGKDEVSAAPEAGANNSRCPADMVAVDGDYCTRLSQKCLRRRKHHQCAEYKANSSCSGREVPMQYCIDVHEWPNQRGALPKVMNSWKDARSSCKDIGKRLCTEEEWTLACEGPQRLAFPYGFVRDSGACPFDKPSPRVNEQRLFWKHTQQAELARLDQRDPSGSYPRCISGYGVRDLTGSVDEWVHYPPGKPYRSSLKGGNWGEYRNACRPVTRGHGENWRYYQTGFRCCQDMAKAAADVGEP